ncbi:ras GEF [Rozella allomycis CSF55]|uniref:Ras GEF n=1 Tax=Rozella allomycis (strain CSF55) TaxID=988480 RepID=A0A4P9YHF8_ROZAC|nr:ras GEF [Rozella allomycis CSF55]RKP19022.1 ras GEF [Rozella allomycis CSF55]
MESLYWVLDDYNGESSNTLNIFKEQIVLVYQKEETGWWYGYVNGEEGWIPMNYLEEIKRLRHIDEYNSWKNILESYCTIIEQVKQNSVQNNAFYVLHDICCFTAASNNKEKFFELLDTVNSIIRDYKNGVNNERALELLILASNLNFINVEDHMLQFIQNEDIITESDIQKLYMYSKLMYNISPHQIFKKAGDICMNFLEHHTDFSQVLEVIGELEFDYHTGRQIPKGQKYDDVSNEYWYLETENNIQCIEYSADGSVKAATLDSAIIYLTTTGKIICTYKIDDPNFREAFFTTLLQFTTSKLIIDLMKQRFFINTAFPLDQNDETVWKTTYLYPIRLRILQCLKSWMRLTFRASEDSELLDGLKDILSSDEVCLKGRNMLCTINEMIQNSLSAHSNPVSIPDQPFPYPLEMSPTLILSNHKQMDNPLDPAPKERQTAQQYAQAVHPPSLRIPPDPRLQLVHRHLLGAQIVIEDMSQYLDPSRNFGKYRELLRSSPAPAVPFMGVHVRDVMSIQASYPTHTEKMYVNFEKFGRMHRIIESVMAFRDVDYKYRRNQVYDVLCCLIKSAGDVVEDELSGMMGEERVSGVNSTETIHKALQDSGFL